MSSPGFTFELLRFAAVPVSADVMLLEVEGSLSGRPVVAQALRLVVERDGERRLELPAITQEVRPAGLTASFALPAATLQDARMALDAGGVLLDLPAPDAPASADRSVALARELNALRRARTALELELVGERDRAARRETAGAAVLAAAVRERDEARKAVSDASEQAGVARVAAEGAQAKSDAVARARDTACEERDAAVQARDAAVAGAARARDAEAATHQDALGAAVRERDAAVRERDAAVQHVLEANDRGAAAREGDAASELPPDDEHSSTAPPPPRVRSAAARLDEAATVAVSLEDATTRRAGQHDEDATQVPLAGPPRPGTDEDDGFEDDPFEPEETGPVPLRRGPRPGAAAATSPGASRPAIAARRDGPHPVVLAAVVLAVLLVALAAIGLLL